MFFTVLEIQSNEGTKACIPTIYENENDALAKYYTVLAAAAISAIEYHAAHIIRSDGVMTEGRVFDRRTVEEV